MKLSKCCNAEMVEKSRGSYYTHVCSKCGNKISILTPPTSTEVEVFEGDDPTCAKCGFGEWRHKDGFNCKQFVSRATSPTNTVEEVFDEYFPKATVKATGFTDEETARVATLILEHRRNKFMQAITHLIQQARIDELEGVKEAADKVERMDACGCDDYIPHRIAELQAEQEADD